MVFSPALCCFQNAIAFNRSKHLYQILYVILLSEPSAPTHSKDIQYEVKRGVPCIT